jgi:Orsellinic acid/F9775 biosynthesis cluster protein D
VTDDVLLHFQRYHGDILLKIRQAIMMHVNGLNVRPVRDVEIPIGEINAIEGIQIVSGFKCIAGSGCQKLCGTSRSIKVHCRNAHDWNIMKDNTIILIY